MIPQEKDSFVHLMSTDISTRHRKREKQFTRRLPVSWLRLWCRVSRNNRRKS